MAGIAIGTCENGDAWRLPFSGTHVLIARATGSGKESVLWSLIHGLGPDSSQGLVQVWAMDPKVESNFALVKPCSTASKDSGAEAM